MIDFNAYVDVNMIEKNESLVFNVCQLLDSHHKIKTKEHILAVAQKSQQLAKQFHVNEDICLQSALLHDISVIINPNDMKKMAIENNYLLDKAEEKYPFLLHQMVSQWIAQDIFDIWDERILSAIACHTTLKASPSSYDMILFLADKIAWDQEGIPPYLERIEKGLEISLDKACYEYIRYLFENHQLLYPHQNIKDARDILYQKYLPITFRCWNKNDGEIFYKHSFSHELYQYMDKGFLKTLDECVKMVEILSQSHDDVKAVLLDGEIVGCIGGFFDSQNVVKLAYWLDVHYWNQGIMGIALEKFIQQLYIEKNVQYVYAKPFQKNIASQRLLEKLRFQKRNYDDQIITYVRKTC